MTNEDIDKKRRCFWCTSDPEYIRYHDEEWGVETHGDEKLFEYLTLEGAQAGLSWMTILKRRHGYLRAFFNFDIEKVSKMDDSKVEELLQDEGIIRNRLKVTSTIDNAKAIFEIQNELGSFDKFIWGYQDMISELGKVKVSEQMSKDLKMRGFRFVGPTICYAFIQAIGMVNDHEKECFRFMQP